MAPLITLGQAKFALAQRLYDSTEQFWSASELTLYIWEAMRTWNALTYYWRETFIFPSEGNLSGGYGVHEYGGLGYGANFTGSSNSNFFDITVLSGTVRPMTVTDNQLYQLMEYHLLEPITDTYPLAWTGSLQFSISDLMQAVERRRNEALETTGCTVSYLKLTSNGQERFTMPPTVTEIRRIAFIPATGYGLITPMFQDDQWALDSFRATHTTDPAGFPDVYSISTEPIIPGDAQSAAITFDADVVPGFPGTYEFIVLQSGSQLSTTAPTIITIPDDWTWTIKFGAMADLLGRESNSKDLLRAKYCEMRYRQGLALLAAAPAVLTIRSNNIPLPIDAISTADQYNPLWENAMGQPRAVLTAGLNMFALSASASPADNPQFYNQGGYNQGDYGGVGDTTPTSLTATMVANAPIPMLDTEPVLVTEDVFDTLLDYAQHLAAFKMGGQEFIETMPLFDNFMNRAALSFSRLGQQGEFQKLLYQRGSLEDALNPRYADADPMEKG